LQLVLVLPPAGEVSPDYSPSD